MHVVTSPVYVPAPLTDRVSVLTPRGAVAVQVIRLEYAISELNGEDRAYIVSLLRDLIEEATA
jgi:hypothetical protein